VPNSTKLFYFEDPYCFKPERFLDGKILGETPELLVPFSGGIRTCLGKNLA
jgi:cytochrome P450